MDKKRRKYKVSDPDSTQILRQITLDEMTPLPKKIPALIVLKGTNQGKIFKINLPTTSLGRDKGSNIHLNDKTISRKHCLLINSISTITLIDLQSSNGTLINGERVEKKKLTHGDKINIGHTLLKFEMADRDISKYHENLYHQITFDDLSSLYNRKSMLKELDLLFSDIPSSLPFSLLFLDIDFFKKINDTYGHISGSKVLSELGRLLLSNLRSIDIPCRYGGEEFLIILKQTPHFEAGFVAEKIRKLIEQYSFHSHHHKPISITVSIGVAQASMRFMNYKELINRSDEAMYRAKKNGRNLSVVFVEGDKTNSSGFQIL